MAASAATFRVGLVQLRSGRSVAPNLDMAEALVRQAAASGAQYVLTPENTGLMELSSGSLFANIEPEESNGVVERMRAVGRQLGIWLHMGSTAIKLADDKVANRSFLFAPDGTVVARYDKIHMFDVDLSGGESYRESKNYQPGRTAVVVDLPWGRLGMTICYDLRFPALYRALAQAGADFITVPAAFTKQTGEAHWHVLLRARAIETGCYVLAAAQGGMHEAGRATFGHSMVVSPWGEVVAEAGAEPGVILADIDPAAVAEARRRIPSLDHDQPFELHAPPAPAMRAAS